MQVEFERYVHLGGIPVAYQPMTDPGGGHAWQGGDASGHALPAKFYQFPVDFRFCHSHGKCCQASLRRRVAAAMQGAGIVNLTGHSRV